MSAAKIVVMQSDHGTDTKLREKEHTSKVIHRMLHELLHMTASACAQVVPHNDIHFISSAFIFTCAAQSVWSESLRAACSDCGQHN